MNMRGYNHCVFGGNAIADSKVYEGKSKVVSFCLAVNRGKTKDGVDLGTDFLDVKVFGKAAEWTSVKKGEPVVVVGKLRKEKYKDSWTVQVIADHVWKINNGYGQKADEEPFEKLADVPLPSDDDFPVPGEEQADIPF